MTKVAYKTLLLLISNLLSKGEIEELRKIIDELLEDVRAKE